MYRNKPYPKIPGQIRPMHKATPVAGGYELSGRSTWNSGIMHADWVLTGLDLGDEEPRVALIKAGDYEVDAGTIADHCRASINELIHEAGAASFHKKSPLQAWFRDINALSVHSFWDWHSCREQYGRGQVGLEPNHPAV